MAISVDTIQQRIVAHLGSAVGDENLSTVDLLGDINQVYQFDIPDTINAGRFREQVALPVAAASGTRFLRIGF